MDKSANFAIRPERAADDSAVLSLHDSIFGPTEKVRAAYALREGVAHEMPLSFIAESLSGNDGRVIATVRQTKILIGESPVFLLGPFGVAQNWKNKGIGRALMEASMAAAREYGAKEGIEHVMLVGDLAYYGAFGFAPAPSGSITMPRPVDFNRVLVCPIGAKGEKSGKKGEFPKGQARARF